MAAWMLPTDDHSFFEIMIGGEPYVPQAFGMRLGRDDLRQLWPPKATLRTADGEHHFHAASFWQQQLGPRLAEPSARALLERMAPDAQSYVRRLVEDDPHSYVKRYLKRNIAPHPLRRNENHNKSE